MYSDFKIDPATDTVVYEWVVIRFLFDDGRTMDIKAVYDDSHLREKVRIYAKAKAIVGVAYLPMPSETPPPPHKRPTKRAAKAT